MAKQTSSLTDTVNHYSRDGFVGSGAHATRPNYVPSYTRIEGSYAPRRIDYFSDRTRASRPAPRDLPIPLLQGDGVLVAGSRRVEAMPFSVKNVTADEIHFVVSGAAEIKTDFGYLACKTGDFIHIPRAVGYRVTDVTDALETIVVATPGELAIDPDPPRGVLNLARSVATPDIGNGISTPDGTHEMIFRHKGGTTSHFYDFDPLDIDTVRGRAPVQRFNIHDVIRLDVSEGGMPPSRLINDATNQSLFYYLGSRRSTRPPIHVNADYDEIIIYAAGPAPYGAMTEPGALSWVPKGIPHHGAEEDTPEPYQAWLLETRATLEMTEAGASISQLMETGEYGIVDAT